MFGSSFSSSLPSASAPSAGAPSAASASGGKLPFGKSAAATTSTGGAGPSLPFTGFAGGFGDTGGSNKKQSLSGNAASSSASGDSGFSFGGSSGGKKPATMPGVAPNLASTNFGAMFAAASGGGGTSNKRSATGTSSSSNIGTSSSAGLPFAGFSSGGGGLTMSPPKSGGGSTNRKAAAGISFSGAASAAASANGTSTALVRAPTTAVAAAVTTSNTPAASNNNNLSLDNSCISPDGRSFHSYLYDSSLGQHVIVSEFAPFGDASAGGGGNNTPRNNAPSSNDGNNISSLKITTNLPLTIAESINIDPIIGLICVDGTNEDGSAKSKKRRHRRENDGGDTTPMVSTLPWMCLYTRTSAFLLSIGYEEPEEDDNTQNDIQGDILHVVEPFERQLLTSPRGSSILRIRPAPVSNSMFQRCGSVAMLMREGGEEDTVGHVLVLYHGLPESILGTSSSSGGGGGRMGVGRDFGGRKNLSSEGAVTVPLRFDYEDLVRGMKDTVDAENEAYNASASLRYSSSLSTATKTVADFCFMEPSMSTSGAGGFAATSILVLCSDGSVYGASPIIFDGTVLPRTVVVNAISHLDSEIEASTTCLGSMPPSPVPTLEQERLEARLRQCRAARRYLLDAFGIPEGVVPQHGGRGQGATTMQGSYYVSASVVHCRSYTTSSSLDDGMFSQALTWQPRLQGPLISPEHLDSTSPPPPCMCIESFGGAAAGAGIIDGFIVARGDGKDADGSSILVEFGILPGEGVVILPRFEFESDADCQLIDELVRGTGMFVERASIMNDMGSTEETEESGGTSSRALTSSASVGRGCSIVVDPLDDIMVHVMTRSRIVTVTTNAVAVTANCFKSRVGGSASLKTGEKQGMPSIRTKVWSGLEVNSSDAALVGAQVSGDVHLGHILLARVSSGAMEVVNITATQCLHETSEQMLEKSKELDAYDGDDEALEILKRVKPLHELLQPLIDKVCDGLSKMGKIVGGATLPKDAGPENLAVFLDTQHSCEVNVLMPMEEMSKILSARRELLKEMYDHQAAELVRLTALLSEFKQKYESNLKRVVELESKASVLAERSSAVLTATRELRPQITDAEAAYFKDLHRYETSCNKWDNQISELKKDASSSCDAMSAGAIENGDARCLVDLPPQKIEVCHKLLSGERQMLKELDQKVKESSAVVEQLSKTISGLDSADAARLRLIGGDKENQQM
ncbi:hypothetical protein ACHAXR_008460 [Thalassiosira sp. AJA248-18]